MELVIDYIRSVFSTLCVICMLLPKISGLVKPTWSPENSEAVLNCVVVSDTHLDGNLFRDRNDKLRRIYTDISLCERKVDVLLNVGDMTNSGVDREYRNIRRLERYLKVDHTVVCLGNHDSWYGSDTLDYPSALANFTGYLAKKGIDTQKAYYSTEINGYHFICLATEASDHDEILPVYSEKQLDWFDRELSSAVDSGLPVFVLSHLAAAGKNGITSSNLPERVNEILLSHAGSAAPILFFSGHHHTFSPSILENEGSIYYINMPSTQYNDEFGDDENGGLGMTMEVCRNSITLRVRNFITETFPEGYRFEIGWQ